MSGSPPLRIEPLSVRHDRSQFACGKPELDQFLASFATQNVRRNYSRCFVLVEGESPRILGYYTLSAGGIVFEHLPEELRKKLPRYPMPVAHLGRMAVDREFQGMGYGELLLIDALRRALSISQEIGLAAVEVRAKDEPARSYYLKFGFVPLLDDFLHLYLPMATIAQAFAPPSR